MVVVERPSQLGGVHRRLLDKILRSAGIVEGVCFTSVLKCEPPAGSRVAKKDVDACKAWLWRELKLVRPRFVLALGKGPSSLLQKSGEGELAYLPGTTLVEGESIVRLYRGPMGDVHELVARLDRMRSAATGKPRRTP